MQAAVAFIADALQLSVRGFGFLFLISPNVFNNLAKNLQKDERLIVVNKSPAGLISRWRVCSRIKDVERDFQPDLVYSIGFPSYVKFKCVEVGRYTNGWEILNNLPWDALAPKDKVFVWLKARYRLAWARRARYFETQTETAKRGIIKKLNAPSESIIVLPNSLNPTFLDYINGANRTVDIDKCDSFYVFCLAAPHKHKNLTFIPYVANALKKKYQITKCRFVLTVPETHPIINQITALSQQLDVSDMVINSGHLTIEECIGWYDKSSIVFLPTLLEIFSATYLEAMAMERPIVTTNLDFAREVCGEAALYFDPFSADEAAGCVAMLINDPDLRDNFVKKGVNQLQRYLTSREKHEKLLAWFKEIIESQKGLVKV